MTLPLIYIKPLHIVERPNLLQKSNSSNVQFGTARIKKTKLVDKLKYGKKNARPIDQSGVEKTDLSHIVHTKKMKKKTNQIKMNRNERVVVHTIYISE